MTEETVDGVGVELLPDWTPTRNPGLGRFDVVVKVAAGTELSARTDLRLRLLGASGGPRLVALPHRLVDLSGPTWREVHGHLIDIDADVSEAEVVFGGKVSARVARRGTAPPVALRPFRDILGISDEPVAWWSFFNSTEDPVDVRTIRTGAVLWVDDRPVALPGTYNGPAALPPRRAMRGLLSAADLGVPARGVRWIRLVMDDHVSDMTAVNLGDPL